MDPAQFFTASRLVMVAGKGGVGKTTVTAAMARAAARSGLSALVVEIEGKGSEVIEALRELKDKRSGGKSIGKM